MMERLLVQTYLFCQVHANYAHWQRRGLMHLWCFHSHVQVPFPLIVAARRGYTEVTKTLIASESDVNIQNEVTYTMR